VIERKYLDMLQQLTRASGPQRPLEPLPGWLARRRKTLRPAKEILAEVPTGPVLPSPQAALAR
jgi:hypothetical protein